MSLAVANDLGAAADGREVEEVDVGADLEVLVDLAGGDPADEPALEVHLGLGVGPEDLADPVDEADPEGAVDPAGMFLSLAICFMVWIAWVTDGSVKAIFPLNSWSYLSAPAWSR